MNIYFTIGFIFAAFVAGWTTHVWYTGYKGENAAITQEHKAAAGEVKIIKDTATIQKVIIREKTTDCGNAAPPAGITGSLR